MTPQMVLALVVVAGAADRPTLRGTVLETGGAPLANAKVLIYTAQPRVGTSSFCPSCYIDCGRGATTGSDGRFEIARLDPTLLFRVVAVAQKHQAVFQDSVDPTGAAISLSLPLSPALPTNPRQVLRGQVVGPTGPVASAIIEPQGYTRVEKQSENSFFGGTETIMPPTVTDSAGEFEIALGVEADSVVLLVSPRGLTRRTYPRVATGMTPSNLIVSYGAGVRGRIVKDGRPLTGIAVNLEQQNQDAAQWVGVLSARTDDAGVFLVSNALPDEDMVAFASSQDLATLGFTPARPLRTPAEGSVLDLGDVEVKPGHTVSGRVALSDGNKVPPNTRLLLARETMTDARDAEVAADGTFAVSDVPDEPVSLSLRVPGYRLSTKNASRVPRGSSLLGAVPSDLRLTILLEPEGPHEAEPRIDQSMAEAQRKAMAALRKKPLEGVTPLP